MTGKQALESMFWGALGGGLLVPLFLLLLMVTSPSTTETLVTCPKTVEEAGVIYGQPEGWYWVRGEQIPQSDDQIRRFFQLFHQAEADNTGFSLTVPLGSEASFGQTRSDGMVFEVQYQVAGPTEISVRPLEDIPQTFVFNCAS